MHCILWLLLIFIMADAMEHFVQERLGEAQVLATQEFKEKIILVEHVPSLEKFQSFDQRSGRIIEHQQWVSKPVKKEVVVNREVKMVLRSNGKFIRVVAAEDYEQSLAITSMLTFCDYQIGAGIQQDNFEFESSVKFVEHEKKDVDLSNLSPDGPFELFKIDIGGSPPVIHCGDSVSNEDSVRVMSANLWNHNHWDMRKELLKEIFDKENPAIIGFQEVRSRKISHFSHSRYQVADLEEILPGYEFVFQPAMMFKEESSGKPELVHEGLAIFSRLPVISSDFLKLS
jgi:hypothetical protein